MTLPRRTIRRHPCRHRVAALGAVIALTLSACSGGSGKGAATTDVVDSTAPPTTPAPATTSTTEAPTTTDAAPSTTAAGAGVTDAGGQLSYQDSIDLSLADIQAYWRTTFPKVYNAPYEELQGKIYAVRPGSSNVPGCGADETLYSDVEGNAFYCSLGDFIAFDDADLLPGLYKDFDGNGFVIAVVFAHEFGHAIQARAGISESLPTVVSEQQADCFAGSWVRHVADGQSDNLVLSAGDIDLALAGLLRFEDPPGSDIRAEGAHGSGFDRVRAFQEGYDDGAERCATYPQDDLPLLDLTFTAADEATGGNLDAPTIVTEATTDLERFWKELLAAASIDYTPLSGGLVPYEPTQPLSCGSEALDESFITGNVFYCPAQDAIFLDGGFLDDVGTQIGDFAVATLVGGAWADAMLVRLESDLTGKARSLQGDCLTGVWTADVYLGRSPSLSLSPGDLDEAVVAFLAFGDSPDVADRGGAVGSAFERTASFRKGFVSGVKACAAG